MRNIIFREVRQKAPATSKKDAGTISGDDTAYMVSFIRSYQNPTLTEHQGDADTELDISRPQSPHTRPQITSPNASRPDVSHSHLNPPEYQTPTNVDMSQARIAGSSHSAVDHPTTRPSLYSPRHTESAIMDLFARVAYIRAHSDPEVFERLAAQHLGRTEEYDEVGVQTEDQSQPRTVVQQELRTTPALPVDARGATSDHDHGTLPLSTRSTLPSGTNGSDQLGPPIPLSNLPFLTDGPPQRPPLVLSSISYRLPATIATYITTTQTSSSAPTTSYSWPSAPCLPGALQSFLAGIDLRHNIPSQSVHGWVLSYGWNDLCRFILNDNTMAADTQRSQTQAGWLTFQEDLVNAARQGVTIWRMKVCVVVK